ncbi:unnamed protein product, partial [Meganyctiphanes norvegica]
DSESIPNPEATQASVENITTDSEGIPNPEANQASVADIPDDSEAIRNPEDNQASVENIPTDSESIPSPEANQAATTDEVCFICMSEEGDSLKLFVPKTWSTFKTAAKARCLLKTDCYRGTTIEVNLKKEMGSAKYHSKCYQNYTAVKRSSTDTQNKKASKKQKTRKGCEVTSSDTKDLLKGSCIFCPVKRKTIKRKVEHLSDCNTLDGNEAIIAAAPRSKNERLKAIVCPGIDLRAKEAQYHKSCHRKFFRDLTAVRKTSDSSNRSIHATTFEEISVIIELQIIEKGKSMF